MATLSGTVIKNTYQGLLKTSDSAAISGTLKTIQDGSGNVIEPYQYLKQSPLP